MSGAAAGVRLAESAGVPVPPVHTVCSDHCFLGGPFFIGTRIEGETIARKILRDDAFTEVRPKLAYQCGEILARIHSISRAALPTLGESPGRIQCEQ